MPMRRVGGRKQESGVRFGRWRNLSAVLRERVIATFLDHKALPVTDGSGVNAKSATIKAARRQSGTQAGVKLSAVLTGQTTGLQYDITVGLILPMGY